MEFNYGLERKRFDGEWERLRKSYHEAGMSDEVIPLVCGCIYRLTPRRASGADLGLRGL